ncbi:fimbria/pilus periplasmic chaperone [Burkholderia sp. BCC1644]|uniref:fimbrial biogenesis chaperone n=1 Tax=Burkholderia sp. BCC1644 TaxID=2676293 RepID=UPI00158FA1A4|nr:fimbria/pilus periplasmic chaperone [Burkholderia sp. BCC1644]
MNWRLPKPAALLALCATLWATCSPASVVITGTRVIFPGDSREVTVRLANDGNAPALVQAWIDTGNEKEAPEQIAVPFVLTPSMFRLDPGKGQSLRLIKTEESLPADRESLFWLNVLEVPPKATGDEASNKIQLAFRSRIKVMYRPSGLPGHAATAAEQLKWQIAPQRDGRGYALKASNPTPYVVNLGVVNVDVGGRKQELKPNFVRPGGETEFPLQGTTVAPASAEVEYAPIDDWGTIKPSKRATASAARN